MFLAMLTEIKALTNCPIEFLKADPEDWRDIASGFLLGLFEDKAGENKTSCFDCWRLGANMALINSGIIQVEAMKDKWLK